MSTLPLSNIPLQSCGRCRLATPASLLSAYTLSFHRGTLNICRHCQADIRRRGDLHLLAAFAAPLILFPLALCLPESAAPLAILLFYPFIISLFLLTVVPLHECAHFLTARLLGYDVPLLQFGMGEPAFTFHLGKTQINIGAWIGSGACWPIYRHHEPPPWKGILISAAGPFSNLLLALLAALLMVRTNAPENPYPRLGLLLFFFLSGNGVYFLLSAFPSRRYGQGNDAAHILDRLGKPRLPPNQRAAAAETARIFACLLQGRCQAARTRLQAARLLYPDDPSLLMQDVCLSASECQWLQIQCLLRPQLQNPAQFQALRRVMPYLVLANLHSPAPENLREAQSLSLQLVELPKPAALAVIARAWTLCAAGEHSPAFSLLASLGELSASSDVQALYHHTLAEIHAQLPCPAQTSRHRAWAAWHDPHGIITSQMIPPLFP